MVAGRNTSLDFVTHTCVTQMEKISTVSSIVSSELTFENSYMMARRNPSICSRENEGCDAHEIAALS